MNILITNECIIYANVFNPIQASCSAYPFGFVRYADIGHRIRKASLKALGSLGVLESGDLFFHPGVEQ